MSAEHALRVNGEGVRENNKWTYRPRPCYKRILLKLSGEALMGEDSFGINRAVLQHMIEELRTALDLGVQVGIVVGGGNIFRGVALGATGMDRAAGDYMGMLATVMNAMALQDCCRNNGIEARVQSALNIEQVAEPYIRGKALRHLRLGRVVIFAAGTGNPFMTTDTTQRGARKWVPTSFSRSPRSAIYTADPEKDPTATMYERNHLRRGAAQQSQGDGCLLSPSAANKACRSKSSTSIRRVRFAACSLAKRKARSFIRNRALLQPLLRHGPETMFSAHVRLNFNLMQRFHPPA